MNIVLPVSVQLPTSPIHLLPLQVRRHSSLLFSHPIKASLPSRLYQALAGLMSSGHPVTVLNMYIYRIIYLFKITKLSKVLNISFSGSLSSGR